MGILSSIYPPRRTHGLFPAAIGFVCVLLGGGWTSAQTILSSSPASSLLRLPSGVAFDAQGDLFFSDTNGHTVQRIDHATGTLTTAAGNGVQGFAGDGGPATAAQLDSPAGLAVDAAGNLYIADSHNHRIRRMDAASGHIASFAGTGVPGFGGDGGMATAARLDLPSAVAVDGAGDLYIVDTNNHRVRKVVAATGAIFTVAGDGRQGFAGDGALATAASIDSPVGLALDASGNLYLADAHNQRVRRVDAATGTIATVAGTGTAGFFGDGASAAGARLALPQGVTVDGPGNVYVADTNNQRVRRIATDGTISTVAGSGAQAFLGDGGLAVAASLNAPRGLAVSPGGLPTMADSGNQRVRQVEANGTIVTLAGVGAVVPVTAGTLTLSAPSTVTYGGGTLTATLAGGGQATGTVTFYEGGTTLGSVVLSSGRATFATGALSAGTHSIHASYTGDASDAPATSAPITLPVSPAPVVANVAAPGLIYGEGVPPLTGTLAGVLARDLGAVSLQLSSSAGTLSPVGSYPVTGSLTGAASGDYVLQPVTASVTIAKAGSVASLTDSAATVASGSPVTLTVHLASATRGVPTGAVTLMDGVTTLVTVPLSSTGDATYTSATLTAGTHSLVGVYAGDENFNGSTTAVQTVAVSSPPAADFTIAATGSASQTVPAGSAANFSFAVQMEGGTLAGPIALAASGLPAGTTASFNPGTVVPGGADAFQLTVQTPAAAVPAALCGLLLLPLTFIRLRRRIAGAVCVCGLIALMGCGANVIAVPSAAKSYAITVSGTATSSSGALIQRSATVTLNIQ